MKTKLYYPIKKIEAVLQKIFPNYTIQKSPIYVNNFDIIPLNNYIYGFMVEAHFQSNGILSLIIYKSVYSNCGLPLNTIYNDNNLFVEYIHDDYIIVCPINLNSFDGIII